MITVSELVRFFSDFWTVTFPLLRTSFVREFNRRYRFRITTGDGEPVSPIPIRELHNRSDLVSEIAFSAAQKLCVLNEFDAYLSLGDPKLASAIIAASERIGRLKNQKIQMLPSEEELQEADDLLKVYFEFFRSSEHRLEFRPKFPGLGILSATEADICSHTYICEVKTVTRGISMSDIRQLLTYCALGLASDRSSWVDGLFFNPRSAVYYRFDIRGMLTYLSGRDHLEAIATFRDLLCERETIWDQRF
jgi:hypothetical protein